MWHLYALARWSSATSIPSTRCATSRSADFFNKPSARAAATTRPPRCTSCGPASRSVATSSATSILRPVVGLEEVEAESAHPRPGSAAPACQAPWSAPTASPAQLLAPGRALQRHQEHLHGLAAAVPGAPHRPLASAKHFLQDSFHRVGPCRCSSSCRGSPRSPGPPITPEARAWVLAPARP